MIKGVVQGYRPQVDWGGESGSATIVMGGQTMKLGTSGWRRRCLYTLLLALLVISIINLSLTLWILKTLHFNVDGMGNLEVITGGVKLSGTSFLSADVFASRISSRKDNDLSINGYYNLSMATTNINETIKALHIGVDDVTASARGFRVFNNEGVELFAAMDDGDLRVDAKHFNVTGSDGASFKDSMQTPLLYSEGAQALRIESVTRDLNAQTPGELRVEARDGDISATSRYNAQLIADRGAIRFENPNIYLPKLLATGPPEEPEATPPTMTKETQVEKPSSPTAGPFSDSKSNMDAQVEKNKVEIFQVCVCPSGRLFVVASDAACIPAKDSDVCLR
ncbi:unnamed protein product [Meganyctiphanes norvegica]|uniref:Uncharacterized protein n=1 Tax=Meganyctiphanes norvegica TaxID=48144 RepID=A0AAV2RS00_MEGNR